MEAYPNLKPWRPGQSGNLKWSAGWGSRSAFSAGFLSDLAEGLGYARAGQHAAHRQDQPGVFFATCAQTDRPQEGRLHDRAEASPAI